VVGKLGLALWGTNGGRRTGCKGLAINIEDRLYEWVDANPPPPDRSFSGGRAAKLFLTLLITALLGALPYAFLDGGLSWWKRASEEERRQEELRNSLIEVERAAREGKTGEATRRLFGIQEPERPTGEAEGPARHP
jgi:hypothetical protein